MQENPYQQNQRLFCVDIYRFYVCHRHKMAVAKIPEHGTFRNMKKLKYFDEKINN